MNYGLFYCNSEIFYRRVKDSMHTMVPNEYALVSVDFDNFNFVNDLFGYEAGDQTLRCMEEYFSLKLNKGEFFSRIHADHFVFWVKATDADSIIQRFSALTNLQENLSGILPAHYNLVFSGGIVFVDNPAENLPPLLDKANFARKKAKGNHASTFLVYNQEMGKELTWKKIITLTMESSLHKQEFEMYLQPKISIRKNQIAGAEALVRWNSEEFGLIFPDSFIPVMEQNGFVKQLDFFMLEQACLFLRKSIEEKIPPLPISVNFSKIHIQSPHFVEQIYKTVHGLGIPASLIEIELTENVFINDFETLVDIARGLKQFGFKVSLDDFGSAYSSLNHLKDIPLDIIKIDKGFLNSSSNTENGRIIIAKMVELIKSLRLVSVMEGVEEQEQVEFLQRLGCDLGQGYYYAKPMPTQRYKEFVKNGLLPSNAWF